MNTRWKIITSLFLLVTILVWITILTSPSKNLKVIACSVGQGDALLVSYGSNQIVIDGGPSNRILECLGRYIPFWDRTIEIVILTNPDLDHFYGLTGVVNNYKVLTFVSNPYKKSGNEYQKLVDAVAQNKISILNPTVGASIKMEDLSLEFVWPTETYSSSGLNEIEPSRTHNELSLVFNLKYKDFDALFTGDIVPGSLDELLETNKIYDVEYLKVPHHGSKNGLTQELFDTSKPEVAIISVGDKNRYGHPNQETLNILQGVKTLRTDKDGDIILETDGTTWWIKE